MSVLHMACINEINIDSTEIVELLINTNIDLNIQDSDENTCLCIAIIHRLDNVAKCLIYYNADVNLTDSDGYSALHIAVKYSSSCDIIKRIIDANADVNVQINSGKSALHLACEKNNLTNIELLIESGINIEIQDRDGYTALHVAAEHYNIFAIQLLLEKNVNINSTEFTGNTALHLVCYRNIINYDMVKFLLESNIDPNILNHYDENALMAACASSGNTTDINIPSIKLLINHCSTTIRNTYGHTILHNIFFIDNANIDVVKLIINTNIDINATSKRDQHTALFLAANLELLDESIIYLLLDSGADIFKSLEKHDNQLLRTILNNKCNKIKRAMQ